MADILQKKASVTEYLFQAMAWKVSLEDGQETNNFEELGNGRTGISLMRGKVIL